LLPKASLQKKWSFLQCRIKNQHPQPFYSLAKELGVVIRYIGILPIFNFLFKQYQLQKLTYLKRLTSYYKTRLSTLAYEMQEVLILDYMQNRIRITLFTFIVLNLIACKEEIFLIVPTVSTTDVTDIGTSSATASGELIEVGDSEILALGFVAATTTGPTTASAIVATVISGSQGAYTLTINGFRSNTIYYLRAYATNKAGTAYGDEVTFQTGLSIPQSLEFAPIKDISGHNFTQSIGFQGSESMQSLFLANRERDPISGIDIEKMSRYDLLTQESTSIFNSVLDFITKEIQIIDNQPIIIGAQFISTYQADLINNPAVVTHGKRFTRHGTAQMDGEIYVYGGDLNGIESNLIRKWDFASQSFTTIATMPTAKSYAGGEIVNGKLYVFGGQKEFLNTLRDDIIYIYSIAENSFETLNLPEPLFRSFTAQVGSLIYVAGHIIDPTGFDSTDIFFGVFDTTDNSFTEIEFNLSDAGTGSIWALTAVGNDLYVVYGDPVIDVSEITGQQEFTIQKAEIP